MSVDPKERFPTWTSEGINKFEDRWPVGTPQRFVFGMALYAGARRSEVPKLGPEDFCDGYLLIDRGDRSGKSSIPIVSRLKAILDATPVDVRKIVTGSGRPMTACALGVWFHQACKKADVAGRYAGLRHSLAVSLCEAGASEAELTAMMGWRGPVIFPLKFPRSQERLRSNAASKLEEYWKNSAKSSRRDDGSAKDDD